MILDLVCSEVGRATHTKLDALRRQLGVGTDPTYDYSAMAERIKQMSKKEKRSSEEPERPSESHPGSSLDQLRKALREVTAPPEEVDVSEARGDPQGVRGGMLSPGQARAQREQARPSPSFLTLSREEKRKLDVGTRFRAPPLGSYRPQSGLCRPRLAVVDFAPKRSEDSRKVHDPPLEPFQDNIPEGPRSHVTGFDLSKQSPRAELVTHCNLNSFTAGILEGDLQCSQSVRSPKWDFSKTSSAKIKEQQTYFQPGQYKANMDVVRPKIQSRMVFFDKQQPRKPLVDAVPTGLNLPDRSLARSCPALASGSLGPVPDFSKNRARDDGLRPEKLDQRTLRHHMTFNPIAAEREAIWRRSRPAESFDKAVDRSTQMRGTRTYGEDVPSQMTRENLDRGPHSVDLLPDVESPHARRRVANVVDFSAMAGREENGREVSPPARGRPESRSVKFRRATREGDTRSEARMAAAAAKH